VPQLAQLVAVTPTLLSFLDPLTEFLRARGDTDRVDEGSSDPCGGKRGDGVGVTDIPSENLDKDRSPKGESGEANRFRLPAIVPLLLALATAVIENGVERGMETSSISLS